MSDRYAHLTTLPNLAAGADLSSHQYKVVKFASTANQVVVVTATTDNAIGVLQNDPNAQGQPAVVAGPGSIAVALAGTSDLAVGERVGYNTTGQVVDHTTDNRRIIGQSMDASTAIGDEVRIILSGLTRF